MRHPLSYLGAATLAAACMTAPALADPGSTTDQSGAASATVADPVTIQRISDMRFGRFASPGTASSIRVNLDGTINAFGDVASSTGMAQPADGRGPAQFTVEQAGNRGGTVFIPSTITITSGAANMVVNSMTGRLTVIAGVGRNRIYRLDMGGTLRVNANQAPGQYRGDFDVTVIYN